LNYFRRHKAAGAAGLDLKGHQVTEWYWNLINGKCLSLL